MHKRAGIILQARFGSSRLPGKAMERIGARVMVEHCLRRLILGGVGRVILATTAGREDDVLAGVAARLGVPVFRGDVDDVLGRYLAAAIEFNVDPIVRATGDNPAVDVLASGRVLAALRSTGADYVREDGLPLGAAVEGITYAALRRAALAASLPEDREHVTTYVKRHAVAFRIAGIQAPAPLSRPDLRLTVDTREDLEYMRQLFVRAGSATPTLRQLIDTADRLGQAEVA
jgi:spore coat polysaccharide biosynthesis protein SpsF